MVWCSSLCIILPKKRGQILDMNSKYLHHDIAKYQELVMPRKLSGKQTLHRQIEHGEDNTTCLGCCTSNG